MQLMTCNKRQAYRSWVGKAVPKKKKKQYLTAFSQQKGLMACVTERK